MALLHKEEHCRLKPHQERPSGEALLEQREQDRLAALFFNAKMIRRVGAAILQKEEEDRLRIETEVADTATACCYIAARRLGISSHRD